MNLGGNVRLLTFPLFISLGSDTEKTDVNVADTKRVLSEAFLLLAQMDAAELSDTMAKGLAQAKKKMNA